MDLSRRKYLGVAATGSLAAIAGCLDPDEGSEWDIWLGGDDDDSQETETPDQERPDRGNDQTKEEDEHDHDYDDDDSFERSCDTRFRVPKGGAVYFRENSEVSGDETLEGVISDEGDETLEIQYLNRVKYLGDGGFLFKDEECFDYTPGGLRDTDSGDWHSRCFEIIHEYDDSYLVQTQAIKDVPGFDERRNVPVCVYDSDH